MLNVYNQHCGQNTQLPTSRTIKDVHDLARAAARLGYNAFYRMFEVQPDGSEKYVGAWSVLQGRRHRVVFRKSVTFPRYHW